MAEKWAAWSCSASISAGQVANAPKVVCTMRHLPCSLAPRASYHDSSSDLTSYCMCGGCMVCTGISIERRLEYVVVDQRRVVITGPARYAQRAHCWHRRWGLRTLGWTTCAAQWQRYCLARRIVCVWRRRHPHLARRRERPGPCVLLAAAACRGQPSDSGCSAARGAVRGCSGVRVSVDGWVGWSWSPPCSVCVCIC